MPLRSVPHYEDIDRVNIARKRQNHRRWGERCHWPRPHRVPTATLHKCGDFRSLTKRCFQRITGRSRWLPIDLESEESIASAAEAVCEGGPIHAVLVATGLLHEGKEFRPEKAIRQLSGGNLERSFRINAVGPALIGKHFLPRFPKRERGYFAALSARVGSISDNRVGGWYGYRASKAALNMFLKNFSIEAKRSHPELIIAGLQPGTVDSALSRPFQGSAHHVLEPEESAQGLLEALNSLDTTQSGILIDWKGVSFEP